MEQPIRVTTISPVHYMCAAYRLSLSDGSAAYVERRVHADGVQLHVELTLSKRTYVLTSDVCADPTQVILGCVSAIPNDVFAAWSAVEQSFSNLGWAVSGEDKNLIVVNTRAGSQ